MLKTWISRGATIAPAGFAVFTWYQRLDQAAFDEKVVPELRKAPVETLAPHGRALGALLLA